MVGSTRTLILALALVVTFGLSLSAVPAQAHCSGWYGCGHHSYYSRCCSHTPYYYHGGYGDCGYRSSHWHSYDRYYSTGCWGHHHRHYYRRHHACWW